MLFWAAVVGALAGLVGAMFQWLVEIILHWRRGQLIPYLADTPVLWWLVPVVVSAVMAYLAFWLVTKFAPETSGSGVQEIEGALDEVRPMRWKRILPIKFFGGMMSLGAGLVLGREGPTIQMGGALGKMIAVFTPRGQGFTHVLTASGAGAGLAAAFNAPLAGILFVIEEMRPQFKYGFLSVQSVTLACVTADIVVRVFFGQGPDISMDQYTAPPLHTLWLFGVLGGCFGVIGYMFNTMLLRTQDFFLALPNNRRAYGAMAVGALVGLLSVVYPDAVGGGYAAIPWGLVEGAAGLLLLVWAARFVMTMVSYGCGVPGGIFAPMMALGVIFGMAFGHGVDMVLPGHVPNVGVFAVAGMGALFAATVRAPLTGIALAIEMTDNYELILPLIFTCLAATLVAQGMGGKPIYSVLLQRTLRREAVRRFCKGVQEDLDKGKAQSASQAESANGA